MLARLRLASARVLRGGAAALLAAGALAAHAADVVLPGPDGLALRAHWFPATNASGAAQPVVLALHGCGGLQDRQGRLSARDRDYVQWLGQRGYQVLMPDSFGSRGLGSQCGTRYGDRQIGVSTRRQDVLAALAWLKAQHVDASRVALLGWSNGATTALTVLDPAQGDVPALAGAAVFYPGCGAFVKRNAALAPQVPLLVQLGAADDWTPPEPCQRFVAAQQARGHTDVTLREYEGAYHGFDSTAPVRFRVDVPNGVNRAGVHQGGDPAARAQALAELDRFLARVLAPPSH